MKGYFLKIPITRPQRGDKLLLWGIYSPAMMLLFPLTLNLYGKEVCHESGRFFYRHRSNSSLDLL